MENNNNRPTTPPMRPGCGCQCGQVRPPVTPPSDDKICGTCFGRVGYAFVPVQTFNDIYSPAEGLQNGTIYPELNMPFGMYGAEVG